MYTLFRSLSLRQALVGQAPVALVALGVAEVAYKFHSFTLEAAAFLVTWFVFDALIQLIKCVIHGRNETVTSTTQH